MTSEFRKNFVNLDEDVKGKVKEILRGLEYSEKIPGVFHVPLKRDLVGYNSIHFNNNSYRLIYRTTNDKTKVIVLIVGPRGNGEDIYDRFRRLRSEGRL